MNEALRKPMSVADFLAWAEARPERKRYELVDGIPVAMAAQNVGHVRIKVAAVNALQTAIDRAGIACFALGDGVTVPVDDHTASSRTPWSIAARKPPSRAWWCATPW